MCEMLQQTDYILVWDAYYFTLQIGSSDTKPREVEIRITEKTGSLPFSKRSAAKNCLLQMDLRGRAWACGVR